MELIVMMENGQKEKLVFVIVAIGNGSCDQVHVDISDNDDENCVCITNAI